MAFRLRCTRCGYEQEAHDPNLVNEPAEGDYANIETAAKGYPISILECLEAKWPKEYATLVKNLYWGFDRWLGYGYVSPDPNYEVAQYQKRPRGIQTSVLIVYVPRLGGSVAIPLD